MMIAPMIHGGIQEKGPSITVITPAQMVESDEVFADYCSGSALIQFGAQP